MTIKTLCKHILIGRLNIFLTIYVNLKMVNLNDALKFPILIYGRWKFFDLSGKIEFRDSVKMGMLVIGVNLAGYVTTGKGSIRLSKDSILIVRGDVIISQGCNIYLKTKAILDLGHDVKFGDSVKVICSKSIIIGRSTDLTWESQIMDNNSHFVENMNDNTIPTIYKPIIIGDYCWIGNRTSIMPGTVLPKRIIVASNSLLNKDYVKLGLEPYSILAGIPAKLIVRGYKRIYDRDIEEKLHQFFIEKDLESVDSKDFQ